MQKKIRKPQSRKAAPPAPLSPTPETSAPPEGKRVPYELLVISICFLLVGGVLTFAKRGTVRALPANHQGAQTTVAAMPARDMRACGWFSILLGFGFLALAGKQWTQPDEAETP